LSFDPSEVGTGTFPAHVGVEVVEAAEGKAEGRLAMRPEHLAPNGYLHAGAVATFADTVCGFGCVASLPDGARGFTTLELKVNFLGTARDGTLTCSGRLVHGGRTTQVWDAEVRDAAGRTLALFRCTQLLLR
jgi:1,4-dihydroxy-2-naphthoyl-CoA hydrolase